MTPTTTNASPELPVAVIGAGPVGLAAAAHLLDRGLPFVVLEAGDSVGAAVRAWGHIRTFTPWQYIADPTAEKLLAPTGWTLPSTPVPPTGAQMATSYLEPLAALLGEAVHAVRACWRSAATAWTRAAHSAALTGRSSCEFRTAPVRSPSCRPGRSSTPPARGSSATLSAAPGCRRSARSRRSHSWSGRCRTSWGSTGHALPGLMYRGRGRSPTSSRLEVKTYADTVTVCPAAAGAVCAVADRLLQQSSRFEERSARRWCGCNRGRKFTAYFRPVALRPPGSRERTQPEPRKPNFTRAGDHPGTTQRDRRHGRRR